jgi:hypothetical protein
MAEVRIVASNDRVKRRFDSALDPDDAVGARALLEHWSKKLGLPNARLEVYDRRCRCRRSYDRHS